MSNNSKSGYATYILKIAIDYGVNESLFISYLWFWTKKNQENGLNFINGRTWSFGSVRELAERMPQYTEEQLKLIIKKCVQKGLIKSEQLSANKYDKRNWYALTDMALEICREADCSKNISFFQTPENTLGQVPQWEKQRTSDDFNEESVKINSAKCAYSSVYKKTSNSHCGDLHYPLGQMPQSLKLYKSNYIKKDCLIGNSKTSESTHRQQPSFEKNEQAQDLILQHMLTHPHGCSPEKIKAYRAHRGYRMSTKTWDSAIATLMTIAKEKLPHLSPDDVLDAMLSRHDCCTDFDMLFPEAKQAANITRFEKKAATYNTTPGQSLESVLSDLKRMGGEHNIPQDYDYQDLYNRIFFTNSSNNQHVIFSQEKKGRIETSEPAWRQQARQELSPETLRLLSLSKGNVNAPRTNEEIETDDSKGSAIKSHKDPSVLFTKAYTGTIPEAIGESAPDNPREQEKHPSSIQDLLLMFSKGNTKKKAEPSANHFGEYGDPSEALRATRDRILTKDYSFNERVSPSY